MLQHRSDPDAHPTATLLKAVSDPTRLRLVALLVHGELCVCHIASALEVSQPNCSQHLTVLRNAGLVERRRDGNWIHYSLRKPSDAPTASVLRAILKSVAELAAGDLARLERARKAQTCG